MTENEKAVIIGCYINGATPEYIASIFFYTIEEVKNITSEYEKKNHKVKNEKKQYPNPRSGKQPRVRRSFERKPTTLLQPVFKGAGAT